MLHVLHLLLTALVFVESPKDVDSGPVWETEKAPQEDSLHYTESNPETLEELMAKDHAVLEGDMVLSNDRNAVGNTWPTLDIPYVISPDLASRTGDILSAMAMVSKHTCLSFHKQTSEKNFLFFKWSNGCAAYVGFMGGKQSVFVGPPCIVGNIAHEILHSLGFYHEHTRTDRDEYITVLTKNVMAGMEKNFIKQRGQTFNLSYDTTSIMHYGRGFFSSNGKPTIVAKNLVKDMGQRAKMTKMDTEKVRLLYNCDATKNETRQEISGAVKEENGDEDVVVHSEAPTLGTMHQGHISANKSEEVDTSTTASLSVSLQHLTAATRGCNNTSRGQA